MHKHKYESSNRLNWANAVLACARLWCERRMIARQNIDVFREAMRESAQEAGVTLTDQQIDALSQSAHGRVNRLMQAQGNNTPNNQNQNTAQNTVDDSDESAEDIAWRRSRGLTREQAANLPAAREAALLGGSALAALPALAAAYATTPAVLAQGLAPSAAFAVPTIGGAMLGYRLGKKWGHPVAGTVGGASLGMVGGYGMLAASQPLLVPAVNSVNSFFAASGAASTYGAIGLGAGLTVGAGALGAYIGHKIGGTTGAITGGSIGAIGTGATMGLTGYYGGLNSTIATMGPYGAFVLLPAALGAGIGYQFFGGKKGAAVGGAVGAGLGWSAMSLGTSPLASGTVASLAPVVLGPAALGAAGAVGTYTFGKFHKLLWGTDPQVGTGGMLVRGALPAAGAVGTAIALGGTLPAIVGGLAAAGGSMLTLRGLTALHERLWNGTWNDSSASTTTRALRAVFSPVTIPAGIVSHAWSGTVGALWRGFSKGKDYEPKYTSWWNPLRWTETALSLPGRVLRGGVSTGGKVAKASTVGFWKHLWSDSKPLY